MKSRALSYLSGLFMLFFALQNVGVSAQTRQISEKPKPLFSDIKFETAQNLIFVQISLNDSKPLWFILDSGASVSVVNEKLVRLLKLKTGGRNKINAVGGKIDYSLVKNIKFDASGATLLNQTAAAIDLSVLEPKFARNIDGILGSSFFYKYVVEIDYAGQKLNLYDPADFRYTGDGEIIGLEIEGNTPFVRVRLAPENSDFVEGKFLVDTGAISSLYINKQFAERHDLLRLAEKTIPDLFTRQLGGDITGRVGRMRKTAVGNFLFENAIAHFPEETSGDGGSLTSSTNDGIIGGAIFRRFTIIFDYSRRQMIWQPNVNTPAPFEFDQSGLEIIGDGADFKTIKVRKVLENSPAAEAGLRVGDVIAAIDGKATSDLSLDAIEEMLSQPQREYDLTILRGDQQLKTVLKLRNLL